MSLSIGIVGLPNVGKSTLFNALLKKQQALVANYPFTTIDPNHGIVPVPDPRLAEIARVVKESEGTQTPPPQVPATVEFVDIAGLVAGANKGEGLGNQFLSHIREATVVCHVLRLFEDQNVSTEGSDPVSDLTTVETELKLADLATLEKQKQSRGTNDKEEQLRWGVAIKLLEALKEGEPARSVTFKTEEEEKAAQELFLITAKPILIVLNIDEDALNRTDGIEKEYAAKLDILEDQVVAISAKIESELAELFEEEREEYLASYLAKAPTGETPGVSGDLTPGVKEAEAPLTGLERLIKKAYATLDLITFFSARPIETRAWTLQRGETAKRAGGVIHTDFEEKFIKADVIPFQDFVALGGWRTAREKGKVRSEGKDYLVQDGDVIEFKFGA